MLATSSQAHQSLTTPMTLCGSPGVKIWRINPAFQSSGQSSKNEMAWTAHPFHVVEVVMGLISCKFGAARCSWSKTYISHHFDLSNSAYYYSSQCSIYQYWTVKSFDGVSLTSWHNLIHQCTLQCSEPQHWTVKSHLLVSIQLAHMTLCSIVLSTVLF